MSLSKKDILHFIKENIDEMAMDFDTQDRPDPELQRKLASGETPLKKVPFPKTGQEPNKNFQELLASERYKRVIENLRNYTGIQTPVVGMTGMPPLIQMMMAAHNEIVETEREYREELQNLAVELVMKEYGIKPGQIEYVAKIVGMGEIDTQDFKREQNQNQPEPEEVNVEIDLYNDLENFNLERAKRRLINSIIQGVSKRGHYMYHYVADKVREITGSENLINQYGVLMSINDTLYWQISDEMMKMAMGGGGEGMVGGKESTDPNANPPKVIAEGVNFPILIHELIKGTFEVLAALHGQPEDMDLAARVMEKEDTMEKEVWDLRLGDPIWDRIRNTFPEDVLTDENKKNIQLLIFKNIVSKPAKQFLVFSKEVISNSDTGVDLMNLLVKAIDEMIKNYNYQKTMQEFNKKIETLSSSTEDNDLKNFLGDLGISMSDENDDGDDDEPKV